MSGLVEVAVLLPVEGSYTYRAPEGMPLGPGARVWVSMSGRGVEGVVLRVDVPPAEAGVALDRVRPIARLVDGPALDPSLLPLARFIADYYLAPIGEALRLLLPPGGRATEGRRVALTDEGRRAAASLGMALEAPLAIDLSLRERAVLERLRDADGDEKLSLLARAVDGAAAAVKRLAEAGLVGVTSRVLARQERTETFVRAVEGAASDANVLARSPRRRAILERLRSGEASLGALRAEDPGAAAAVRALREAGLVTVEERASGGAYTGPVERTAPPVLMPQQERALAEIAPAIDAGGYQGFLLHGATGSGKTEVYLRAIERALAGGRGALALVPEISLTPQLASRFRARFGDEVAVLHSSLSDRERFEAWARLRAGRVRIALGARSAVFAPVHALGLVVVDEEHDGSFKQEEGGARYHGRDVALRRARDASAVAILGSATPSVESYEAAAEGRLRLLALPERANAQLMPTVELVDLRRHRPDPDSMLSAPLVAAIGETLAAREQAILFLNRRGFASVVLCTACGHRFRCRNCAVALTYHRSGDRLACHHCGYLEAAPQACPACQARSVERLGLGTERIEAALAARFPDARVARLDRDTAQGARLERILDAVRRREVDLLVGTQMLAKGHDFPGVTLVGVVLADGGLHLPDFRAEERTFQLLVQVAGRAGRGDWRGRVLMQTWLPTNRAIVHACDHDYRAFFEGERAERQAAGYPPFSRVGLLRVDGEDPLAVQRAAEAAGRAAQLLAERAPVEAGVRIFGPSEAPIARLKGRSRWQLLVMARNARAVRTLLVAARAVEAPAGVRLAADVDPMSTL